MYKVDNLQKMERDFMDNEVKEILMQLVDTTNKLAEGQKQLFECQKQTNERLNKIEDDITDIKEDIADIKEEAKITRFATNHNGDVLEKLVKQLKPLNMIDVEY